MRSISSNKFEIKYIKVILSEVHISTALTVSLNFVRIVILVYLIKFAKVKSAVFIDIVRRSRCNNRNSYFSPNCSNMHE